MDGQRQGVPDFYDNKGVFITGVTGFLAKIFLEKILYSCPLVKNAYVLIRPKGSRATDPVGEDRLKNLLKSKVFDRLREKRPEALSKVVAVWGDVSQEGLGLSESDREMLRRNASIVFHSAATTKFNEPLKKALAINFIGTKNVLELFQGFDEKLAFVYVSTAYSNCQKPLIEETVYPVPVTPDFLVESFNNLSEKSLDSLFETISEGRPNTYTFSKACAENFLQQKSNGLPIVIVRPSIIGSSLEEPSPGWGDSKNLFLNAMHAIGLGLIHCLPMNWENKMDFIPADLVSNLIVVAAWSTQFSRNRDDELPVFNCVSGCDNGLKFIEMQKYGLAYRDEKPSTLCVSYPFMIFSNNFFVVNFAKVCHHYLPALFIDLLRIIHGKHPKYYSMYQRFFAALPYKLFFIEREFNFTNRNVHALKDRLTREDRRVFNFDPASFEWKDYLFIWIDSARDMFYPDEKTKNDPIKAKKKMRLLFWRMVAYNSLLAVGVATAVIWPIYNSLKAIDRI